MKHLLVFIGLLAIDVMLEADAGLLFRLPNALGYDYTSFLESPFVIAGRQFEGSAIRHHRPDHKGTNEDEDDKPKSDLEQGNAPMVPAEIVDSVVVAGTDGWKLYPRSVPVAYHHPLLWPTAAAQFHRQDGHGHYDYGYANPQSSKHEVKRVDGTTHGAYSYIDSNGLLQTVRYISDNGGFRVAATNLPQPARAFVQPHPLSAAQRAALAILINAPPDNSDNEDNGNGNRDEATSGAHRERNDDDATSPAGLAK